MPDEHVTVITPGLVNGNSQNTRLPFPDIPGRVYKIVAVNAVRGGGALLSDGDQWMVGISHQLDPTLANDPDDFISELEEGDNIWWAADLIPHASIFDSLPVAVEVAGPQSIIVHNGSGATTGGRITVYYTIGRISIPRWSLLKTLTSFEGTE